MRKCWEDLIAIFSHIWNKIINWIIIGQNTIIKCKIDVFYGPYDYCNYSCSQNSVQWWHSKIQTWAFAEQIFKNVVIKIRIMCLCKVLTPPTELLKKMNYYALNVECLPQACVLDNWVSNLLPTLDTYGTLKRYNFAAGSGSLEMVALKAWDVVTLPVCPLLD